MSQNDTVTALYNNIDKVITGKKQSVLFTIASLLCKGHILIEDVPGLGKTTLACALAKSINLEFKRVQCTPDLLPSDITGLSIFNQKTQTFEFIKGPVFSNILLADEINRTTPRTQSALLECMSEKQVSIDGTTHSLEDPFMVIATQNPVDLAGTFVLPEAQLDRFFMKISMGYPKKEEELLIMEQQKSGHPLDNLQAVVDKAAIVELQSKVSEVFIDDKVAAYIVDIVNATRKNELLSLGASPRGSLALMKAARAIALIQGENFVSPTVVRFVAPTVLAHRLILTPQARSQGVTGESVINSVLDTIPVPVGSGS